MNASTVASSFPSVNSSAFWELQWRTGGIVFVVLVAVAFVICGPQPQFGVPANEVVTFYGGVYIRTLVAASISGMAVIYLLWFVAAVRTTLANAGQDGWGAAATASSAAVGIFLLMTAAVRAALASSIVGSDDHALASTLNDFAWTCFVLSSFPRAMLLMSCTFGLWRAGLMSNALFAVGVAALVLVLLGGTVWFGNGFWSPDGVYSRFVSPIIGLVWALALSGVLLARAPATRTAW